MRNSECGTVEPAARGSFVIPHSAFPVRALPSLVLILYAVAAGVEPALGQVAMRRRLY
jgi:hypothetical protein